MAAAVPAFLPFLVAGGRHQLSAPVCGEVRFCIPYTEVLLS
jgi:hypothetical protein